MTKTRSLIAATLALACAGAFAQSPAAFAARDAHPQARFDHGAQQVSLNAREAARVRQQAQQVERLRQQSLRDGRLSRGERADLHAAQSRLSINIASAVRHGSLSRQEAARLERGITPVSYRETVNLPRHR